MASGTMSASTRQPVHPRLIEMVGIGGAGKSTLFKALNRENPKIQKLHPPSKVRYLPTIARMALRWLPVYLAKYRATRWFTWDETRNICYLDTQLGHIRDHNRRRGVIAVLDPGSVYWLCSLREFGPPFTRDALFCDWWDAKLREWSAALDVIVWIEAPIELLLDRVLARAEVHEARAQSREVALAYFERYQAEYARMVPETTRRGHARLFHFRSDQTSTEKMAQVIFAEARLGAE